MQENDPLRMFYLHYSSPADSVVVTVTHQLWLNALSQLQVASLPLNHRKSNRATTQRRKSEEKRCEEKFAWKIRVETSHRTF